MSKYTDEQIAAALQRIEEEGDKEDNGVFILLADSYDNPLTVGDLISYIEMCCEDWYGVHVCGTVLPVAVGHFRMVDGEVTVDTCSFSYSRTCRNLIDDLRLLPEGVPILLGRKGYGGGYARAIMPKRRMGIIMCSDVYNLVGSHLR